MPSTMKQIDKSGRVNLKYNPINKFVVQLGLYDRRLGYLHPNRTFQVVHIYVHPSYDLSVLASPHDLALLKLDRKVAMVPGLITPVCLPLSTSFPDVATVGGTVSVAGWGAENDPHCTTGLGGPAPFHPCKVSAMPFAF
jgi:hypothetical protein